MVTGRAAAQLVLTLERPGYVRVRVSAACARLLFHGCDPAYIATTCHASCCQSSTSKTGTLITIHPSEQAALEARGATVAGGLLQPRAGERRCPFKTAEHLCGLHGGPDKPWGCIASPFALNKHGTLIVRHRYVVLKCYADGPAPVPAYVAFRASLDLIFGAEEAGRICGHFAAGGGDLDGWAPEASYLRLAAGDTAKRQAAKAG